MLINEKKKFILEKSSYFVKMFILYILNQNQYLFFM